MFCLLLESEVFAHSSYIDCLLNRQSGLKVDVQYEQFYRTEGRPNRGLTQSVFRCLCLSFSFFFFLKSLHWGAVKCVFQKGFQSTWAVFFLSLGIRHPHSGTWKGTLGVAVCPILLTYWSVAVSPCIIWPCGREHGFSENAQENITASHAWAPLSSFEDFGAWWD